jgi:hypothetical protein
MLSRLAPLAAYREDLVRLGRSTIGAIDGLWLEIVLLTEQLGSLPATAVEARLVIESTLRERLDEAPIGLYQMIFEPDAPRSRDSFTDLRRVAESLNEEGGHLAGALLRAAERAFPYDTLGRGRSIALRARFARICGAIDATHELARELLHLAREEGSEELYGRACLILAGAAMERGNYPALERWSRRILTHATEQMPPVIVGAAEQNLMVRHAVAGNFGVALLHGWRSYEYFERSPYMKAEALINMSKLLADAGRPATAARGFIAVMSRQPTERQTLLAWAGLVRCAADLGDASLVTLASTRVLDLTSSGGIPYGCATALVQSAIARAQLGMAHEPWSSRASRFAESGGYHEIAHEVAGVRAGRPPTGPTAPAAATLEPESGTAALTIEEVIGALDSMAQLDDAYTVA